MAARWNEFERRAVLNKYVSLLREGRTTGAWLKAQMCLPEDRRHGTKYPSMRDRAEVEKLLKEMKEGKEKISAPSLDLLVLKHSASSCRTGTGALLEQVLGEQREIRALLERLIRSLNGVVPPVQVIQKDERTPRTNPPKVLVIGVNPQHRQELMKRVGDKISLFAYAVGMQVKLSGKEGYTGLVLGNMLSHSEYDRVKSKYPNISTVGPVKGIDKLVDACYSVTGHLQER